MPTPIPVATPAADPATEEPIGDSVSEAAEDAINAVRIAEGLTPLRHDRKLAKVAAEYARRMAAEGFYSHNDPQGKTVLDRVNGAGYAWGIVGENLARVKTKPGNEVPFTVSGWMNSTKHRANILRADYSDSAIGVAKSSDGMTYLVQVFAAPQ
jgi:uncharacterized protein YkwD